MPHKFHYEIHIICLHPFLSRITYVPSGASFGIPCTLRVTYGESVTVCHIHQGGFACRSASTVAMKADHEGTVSRKIFRFVEVVFPLHPLMLDVFMNTPFLDGGLFLGREACSDCDEQERKDDFFDVDRNHDVSFS